MVSYVSYSFAQVLILCLVRSCSGDIEEESEQVFYSLTDPEIRKEFILQNVDGAWPMGPDQSGAYIVSNEIIDRELKKIINEVKPTEALITDGATGESTVQTIIEIEKVAYFDPVSDSSVVNLYINKEAKFGCAIYKNGIVEVFEFDQNKENW